MTVQAKGVRKKMRGEVNDYLKKYRAVEQEGVTLLVDDIVDGLGVKASESPEDLARSLHDKTLAELVDTLLLEEWHEFSLQVNLGYFGLERVRSTLQQRLSEYAGRVVIVDPCDVRALNFGFIIPSLPVSSRPILTLVKNS